MLCYKDKTFCNPKCANTTCKYNFNEDILSQAKSWWRREETPICFANLRNDDCGFVGVNE